MNQAINRSHSDRQAEDDLLAAALSAVAQPLPAPPQPSISVSASPTLAGLDSKRRPQAATVCEACPNSVWFASPAVVTCYCRVMYLVTWSSREPQQILSCDGLFLGQDLSQNQEQDSPES